MPQPAHDREPIVDQRGLRVTEELTGVHLDPESCAVCAGVRGVSQHHVTFRSRGGAEGPTVPLCNACHLSYIHEGLWRCELNPKGQPRGCYIFDAGTGEIIWRLLPWPFEGDAGDFVRRLDDMTERAKLMPEMAPSLLPWQAQAVAESLRALGEGGWRAQCRLIGEFYARRMPGLGEGERVEALCGIFGLRKSQMYNALSVARAFEGHDLLERTELSMRYAIEAARSEHPPEWLALAQERKLEHPAFSADDLAREIERAGDRQHQPREEQAARPRRVWAKCASCGTAGWMERLPVGSSGEPPDLGEYGE